MKTWLFRAMALASAMTPCPAHAVATVAGTVVSGPAVVGTVVTGTVTGAAGATVAAKASGWWSDAGLAVFIGSVIVVVVDPPDATFYNGSFAINFPTQFLEPIGSGWLGAWGDNPADSAPPVSPGGGFPTDTQFVIHRPSPAMTTATVNDLVNGVQLTTFDWGPNGLAVQGSGQSNFYAALFRVTQDSFISYLGTANGTISGANLFTTNNGIACSAAGSSVIQRCGSPATQSFRLTALPEPSSWSMMMVGAGLLGFALRRRRPAVRDAADREALDRAR